MSENTTTSRLTRTMLAGLALAAAVSGGALVPQTATAVPNFAITAQDDGRYEHEAPTPTPLDSTETGAEARPSVDQPVTRSEILARAKRWVDLGIGYDNYEYFEGYRQDCSGFVSMAWQLAENKTTRSLDSVAHNISKEQLLPGDALLWVNPNPQAFGHVRIFGGWVDAAQTRFWTYEQTPPKAVRREYTWSASVSAGYRAIRYDKVIDDGSTQAGSMLHQVRNDNGSWTGFAHTGGDAKDIGIASMTDASAQLVAIGADDIVYHRARNADGGWTELAPLNGAGTTAAAKGKRVAVAGNLNGPAQVVIVGWDGNVYHRMRDADGGWTEFAQIGGGAKDVGITTMPDGSSQVVIIGADGNVYHRARLADGNWTEFAPLNGVGTNSAAKGKKVSIAGSLNGSAQVLIIGWDGNVYHRMRNADGGWTEFAPLDAGAKDVAITALPDGSTQTLIASPDDTIHHRVRYLNGSWTPFAPLEGFGALAKGRSVSIAGAFDGSAQVAITSL
jgi:hypothetical protein